MRENAAQAKVDSLNRQIAADEQRVAADRRQEAAAHLVLRRVAVSAYMTRRGPSTSPLLDTVQRQPKTSRRRSRGHTYAGSVGDRLATALAALQAAREATEHDANNLRAAKDDAAHTLASSARNIAR